MPESVTKWDKSKIGGLGDKYVDNIKSGPVWDEDDWFLNYVGHPYSGAAYYVVARHAGLSKMQSFGYTAFISTIFWEYGLEAAAEVPSIQDLVVTPVFGALLGEAFIGWSEKINNQEGKLLGSQKLGTVALTLMNPAGAIFNSTGSFFKKHKIFKSAKTYWVTPLTPPPLSSNSRDEFSNRNYMGIVLELKF